MKEKYIRQVKRELSLPRKLKKEVIRDLNEVFASALEHGETEQQVILRLGTPKEFADSTAEQFNVGSAVSKRRREIILAVSTAVLSAAVFSVYAFISSGKVPNGAIGQADAMTNILIDGGFDISRIILAAGIAATAIAAASAVLSIVRTVLKNRR